MSQKDRGQFSMKHGPDASVSSELREAVLKRAVNGQLPCAVAFKVAKDFNISPAPVGRAADLLELPLVKCQLGLFGYRPNKKIVKPAESVAPDLQHALSGAVVDDRLSCETAWEIADRLGIQKMKVSAACDAIGVKVAPCQLGAF